ncbi:MAG: acyl-CoA dehydrogenase [Gammaproteobacteria bacterium]|nr:MAG: acyl-CoA dehydrogenase [Gammaproteobacteria bacterium]
MINHNKGISEEAFQQMVAAFHRVANEVVAAFADDVDEHARFPDEAFSAFKDHQWLSCYVPAELGGMGLSMTQLCTLCEILGGYCASTAMIFAMHQIQVACVVHHCGDSEYFKQFLRDLVANQYVMASATTEIGVGGDLRTSQCALQVQNDTFTIEKQAPVISYGKAADIIMVTCRRNESSNPGDQVQVLVFKNGYELEMIADWDTLGFRGTCSEGFKLTGRGHVEQIQPEPFASILQSTMHPVSHLVWSSLWLGLANDAVNKARATVKAAARKDPGNTPISAMRLTEVDEQLYLMRSGLYQGIQAYESKLSLQDKTAFEDFRFSIDINNVKLRCSEMMLQIVSECMFIVGISGYKNNSKNSLSRHIRDAYGAAIMVNNDRIRGHNATMHLALRGK